MLGGMPYTPRSYYAHIADELRDAISVGRWAIGATIPSEPELAEHYSTSRATINRAVQALRHDGLVAIRRGRGTVVIATEPRLDTIIRRLNKVWDALDRERHVNPDWQACWDDVDYVLEALRFERDQR